MMTYKAAAAFLGIPVGTLYALVHNGKVPHVRYGKRLVRFPRPALEAWLEEHAVPATAGRANGAA